MPQPPDIERNVYTVTRLNREVRVLIERGLGVVWVEGELSNLARELRRGPISLLLQR